MKKIRVVCFVTDGLLVDVITDSSREIEYLVVDSNPEALDKSVISIMSGPFQDYAALVSTSGDTVFNDPARVQEIFGVRESEFGGRNHVV
jgi:hypothetical protein